ncbi:hypothetical protein, partial [Bacteroides thetaiotaomicron]|uniref:hypothetical protein n=1 Tax=Bacteroides thetaiotaomicron TaxID=818 RepID=UPI001F5D1618
TTSLGWDLGRAFFTALLLAFTTRPVLGALRRASRRAAFGEVAAFEAEAASVKPGCIFPRL